jgi:hypothetical protein
MVVLETLVASQPVLGTLDMEELHGDKRIQHPPD